MQGDSFDQQTTETVLAVMMIVVCQYLSIINKSILDKNNTHLLTSSKLTISCRNTGLEERLKVFMLRVFLVLFLSADFRFRKKTQCREGERHFRVQESFRISGTKIFDYKK